VKLRSVRDLTENFDQIPISYFELDHILQPHDERHLTAKHTLAYNRPTCESDHVTYELQFDFKKGVGCNDAIVTLKTVITSSRSSLLSATLDIRYSSRLAYGTPT
jgi:hypothetical protein